MSYADAYEEAMRRIGVSQGLCKICTDSFFIQTGYHEMGVCGDCVKNLAHEYSMAHSGAPDPTFSPREAMEAYASDRPSYRKKKISGRLRTAVFERDAYRCRECGGHRNLCADHVIPESKGGPTTVDNLQTLCNLCNLKKGSRYEP